jgi:alpha-L-arabinofuranosidase
VLSSDDPLDENTFEAPTKVVPKTSTLNPRGTSVAHTFAPYSLTVLRLKPSR